MALAPRGIASMNGSKRPPAIIDKDSSAALAMFASALNAGSELARLTAPPTPAVGAVRATVSAIRGILAATAPMRGAAPTAPASPRPSCPVRRAAAPAIVSAIGRAEPAAVRASQVAGSLTRDGVCPRNASRAAASSSACLWAAPSGLKSTAAPVRNARPMPHSCGGSGVVRGSPSCSRSTCSMSSSVAVSGMLAANWSRGAVSGATTGPAPGGASAGTWAASACFRARICGTRALARAARSACSVAKSAASRSNPPVGGGSATMASMSVWSMGMVRIQRLAGFRPSALAAGSYSLAPPGAGRKPPDPRYASARWRQPPPTLRFSAPSQHRRRAG